MTEREKCEEVARNFVPGGLSMRVDRLTDLLLEAKAQEADWWVEDLALGGNDLDGDSKHLRSRASELRSQIKG